MKYETPKIEIIYIDEEEYVITDPDSGGILQRRMISDFEEN